MAKRAFISYSFFVTGRSSWFLRVRLVFALLMLKETKERELPILFCSLRREKDCVRSTRLETALQKEFSYKS
jgi:hypothetical protein